MITEKYKELEKQLIDLAKQLGLCTLVPGYRLFETEEYMYAYYALNEIESEALFKFILKQNYFLGIGVYIDGSGFHIKTKNRYNYPVNEKVETIEELKTIVAGELKYVKTLKIKQRKEQIEQDFTDDTFNMFNETL